MLDRNAETELWRTRKEQLYYFARQRGPQRANVLKTVNPFLGNRKGSYGFRVENRAVEKDRD